MTQDDVHGRNVNLRWNVNPRARGLSILVQGFHPPFGMSILVQDDMVGRKMTCLDCLSTSILAQASLGFSTEDRAAQAARRPSLHKWMSRFRCEAPLHEGGRRLGHIGRRQRRGVGQVFAIVADTYPD